MIQCQAAKSIETCHKYLKSMWCMHYDDDDKLNYTQIKWKT